MDHTGQWVSGSPGQIADRQSRSARDGTGRDKGADGTDGRDEKESEGGSLDGEDSLGQPRSADQLTNRGNDLSPMKKACVLTTGKRRG